MTHEQIVEVIQGFRMAVRRAVQAGADGVQIHAAHGYLVNQFLSPFFNIRKDQWGGSDENRFRFLKEIITEAQKELPENAPLLVKLSTHDHTPRKGITPPLAMRYARWLRELGISGLEISCGSAVYSFMSMCRGEVPVNDLVDGLAWWKRPAAKHMLGGMVDKYNLQEGYNLQAAKMIKPVMGKMPLLLVGGLRSVSKMESILENGHADFISMSRPFLREPYLVKSFKAKKTAEVSCVSCNKCLAAAANERPVRCYYK